MTDRPQLPLITATGLAAHDRQRDLDADGACRLGTALREVLGGRGPVLDLGVGSGAPPRHLVAGGLRVLGVGLQPAMLAGLRDHAPELPAVAGDLAALPLRSACVAAGHASYVLHHVPDWQRALAEVARVLRPQAVLALNLGPDPPQLLDVDGGVQRAALERATTSVLAAAPYAWGDVDAPRDFPVLLRYRIYWRG